MHSQHTQITSVISGWPGNFVCISPPDSLEEILVVAKVGQYHGRGSLGATPGLTPGCHLHQALLK